MPAHVGGVDGGLKLYLLNKMKDTFLKGQKNNMYLNTIKNKNSFNKNLRLCSSRSQVFSPSLSSFQNQQRRYHISNIKAINRIGPHNLDVLSVIMGSLLGDAYGDKRSGEGVRICYRQSIKHKEYLFWVYLFFYKRGYTSNLQPRQYTRTINGKGNKGNKGNKGKEYSGYEFNTFTFRSFSWIHKMFYSKGKKVVPINIFEFLTPLALAVWTMSSGNFTNGKIELFTNFCVEKKVEKSKLISLLKDRFGLDCSIVLRKQNSYVVIISKESVKSFQDIVSPYIIPTLKYKIGLNTH
ncbi:LAGLIDADG homing endonuclease (mitochondrion) [Pyrrhoderma noxium]|uniref:LAGLIDADG homing endonuclease n=1 Tax=Pyrrhoderma noxium TaxID=2282107 RepID=A0A541AXM5_9AGAM|nr:LAGLIDADG homing endonuclease [Pyrrhoderma noxium]